MMPFVRSFAALFSFFGELKKKRGQVRDTITCDQLLRRIGSNQPAPVQYEQLVCGFSFIDQMRCPERGDSSCRATLPYLGA